MILPSSTWPTSQVSAIVNGAANDALANRSPCAAHAPAFRHAGVLRSRAQAECGVTLPDTFTVYDLDLENPTDPGYFAETSFWKQHPSFGALGTPQLPGVWTTLGSLIRPSHVSASKRDHYVREGSWAIGGHGDHLEARLNATHALLRDVGSSPKVIFAHCNAGCDRTGEVISAATKRKNPAAPRVCARTPCACYARVPLSTIWPCQHACLSSVYRGVRHDVPRLQRDDSLRRSVPAVWSLSQLLRHERFGLVVPDTCSERSWPSWRLPRLCRLPLSRLMRCAWCDTPPRRLSHCRSCNRRQHDTVAAHGESIAVAGTSPGHMAATAEVVNVREYFAL